MSNEKQINHVTLREAETKQEKLLLGFLHKEANEIEFGQISIEFTVHGKKIIRIRSNRVSRTFNLGN